MWAGAGTVAPQGRARRWRGLTMDEHQEAFATLEHGDVEPDDPELSPRRAAGPDSQPLDGDGGAGSSLETRAVKSFAWAALSWGGNRLIVFVATIALTWILVPQDFGVVAAALTVTLFLEAGNDLGLSAVVVYEQERGITARVQTAFSLTLAISVFACVVGVVAAPFTAAFFNVPDQANIFRALSLYLVIQGVSQTPAAMMARDLNFKRRTSVNLTGAIVRAALSIVLAKAGFGAWAIVIGLLVGQTAATTVSWWLVRFRPTFHLDVAVARQMLTFGLPVMAMAFLGTLITNVDYLVVGNRLGEGDLGLYQIGFRVPELILGGVYILFSNVAFPAYSNARVEGIMKLRNGMLRALGLLSLFGFTVGVGLALVARDVVGLFVGPGFAGAATPMALISLTAGVSAVNFASGDIFPAVGKPGLLLRLNVANLALTITALVIAANHGIVWVAFVSLPVHGIYSLCRVLFANRFVECTVRDDLRAIRPALWSSAGVLLVAGPVRLLAPAGPASLVAIVVAGVVGATLALWIGSRSTFGEVLALVRRLKPSRPDPAAGPDAQQPAAASTR